VAELLAKHEQTEEVVLRHGNFLPVQPAREVGEDRLCNRGLDLRRIRVQNVDVVRKVKTGKELLRD
jgi:hypothetical protein